MCKKASFRLAVFAFMTLLSVEARSVTIAPNDALIASEPIASVTTAAAERAVSDVQIRRIKSLLADAEISADTFFSQVENMRKKLGQ